MALSLIVGGSGCGKSRWLYEHLIREAGEQPDRRFLVVVPEQFTVQTGRELIALHPGKGLLNIDVLSFRRLAFQVLRGSGKGRVKVLSESGKSLLIRKAAIGLDKKLPLLGRYLDRQGYIRELKSLLSEFAEYEVTGGDILAALSAQDGSGILRGKLQDILALEEAFEEEKARSFGGREGECRIAEEIPGIFARAVPDSDLNSDCVLAFDGFTGFTPAQMTALRALMRCCGEIFVTVTADPREELFGPVFEHELFALSKRTIQQLNRMALEEGLGQARLICPEGERKRFAARGMLERLESGLMRLGTPSGRRAAGMHAERQEQADQNAVREPGDGEITLHVSADPSGEAQFAAGTVFELIMEQGYAPGEIAVITGDLSSYEHHLARAFSRYSLPYFIDRKQEPVSDPCLELIRAAMEIAEKHFSYESVMRLIRTCLAGIPAQRADRLDLYIRAAGIRSKKRWSQEWVRPTRTVAQEELEALNLARAGLMEGLEPFLEVFGGGKKPVRAYCGAVRALLAHFDVEEKLAVRREQLRQKEAYPMLMSGPDRDAKAEEYRGIYEAVLQVLEEAQELIGGESVSAREFAQMLEAGFSEIRIGKLPPGLEQVYVGDMMRTRLSGIRALLFLGFNDGWIPARREKNGILSELDRARLKEYGVALSPGMQEDACIQRFYLYLCLTKPSERLYLSYARTGSGGASMRPSYLLSEITALFPDLAAKEEDLHGRGSRELVLAESGLTLAAEMMRESVSGGEAPAQLLQLLSFARAQGLEEKSSRLAKSACAAAGSEALTGETAQALYGEELKGSVTRIDQFAQCPFLHFALYGLRLKEREEFQISGADTGTLFHEALERFSDAIMRSPDYDWHTLTEEQREQVLAKSVEEAVRAGKRDLFEDSARSRYVVDRMMQILSLASWAMVRQIQAGAFVPEHLELPFYDRLSLGEDGRSGAWLAGKIDRIDVAKKDGRLWVKIIDYKSGSTRFDLPLMYDGRELQLLVYLYEAGKLLQEQTGMETVPAGIYYSHLTEPQLRESLGQEEEQEGRERLLDELRPDGLTLDQEEALSLLASDEEVRKHVVPVPRISAKTGEVRDDSPSATPEQMRALERFAIARIGEAVRQMREGTIRAVPYREAQRYTCDYCAYRQMCSYDRTAPEAASRTRQRQSRQEMLCRMQQEVQGMQLPSGKGGLGSAVTENGIDSGGEGH